MEHTTLTLTEALYSLAFAQDGIDETNVIYRVRKAQALAKEAFSLGDIELHTPYNQDHVDRLIIWLSRNGAIDIFA